MLLFPHNTNIQPICPPHPLLFRLTHNFFSLSLSLSKSNVCLNRSHTRDPPDLGVPSIDAERGVTSENAPYMEIPVDRCEALHVYLTRRAQVFINYGAKSNHDLLQHYGFAIPGNPADVMRLSLAGGHWEGDADGLASEIRCVYWIYIGYGMLFGGFALVGSSCFVSMYQCVYMYMYVI